MLLFVTVACLLAVSQGTGRDSRDRNRDFSGSFEGFYRFDANGNHYTLKVCAGGNDEGREYWALYNSDGVVPITASAVPYRRSYGWELECDTYYLAGDEVLVGQFYLRYFAPRDSDDSGSDNKGKFKFILEDNYGVELLNTEVKRVSTAQPSDNECFRHFNGPSFNFPAAVISQPFLNGLRELQVHEAFDRVCNGFLDEYSNAVNGGDFRNIRSYSGRDKLRSATFYQLEPEYEACAVGSIIMVQTAADTLVVTSQCSDGSNTRTYVLKATTDFRAECPVFDPRPEPTSTEERRMTTQRAYREETSTEAAERTTTDAPRRSTTEAPRSTTEAPERTTTEAPRTTTTEAPQRSTTTEEPERTTTEAPRTTTTEEPPRTTTTDAPRTTTTDAPRTTTTDAPRTTTTDAPERSTTTEDARRSTTEAPRSTTTEEASKKKKRRRRHGH